MIRRKQQADSPQPLAAALPAPLKPGEVVGRHPCGFCGTGSCTRCPVFIKNAAGGPGTVWFCPCAVNAPENHQRYVKVPRLEER